MVSKYIIKLSILFAVVLFTGCATNYIPGVANAPLLKNKGEIQASINGGTSAFSPKTAYAISDNIGVMLNGSFSNRDTSSVNSIMHKHNYVEGALGYFESLGTNGIFEIYAGYGLGNIKTSTSGWAIDKWNTETYFINHRFFIQPSVGYYNNIIHVIFTTKFSLTNISKNSINKNVFFVSPAATIKLGFKQMKIVWQFGASIRAFGYNESSTVFDYNPFVMNIGIEFDLFRNYE